MPPCVRSNPLSHTVLSLACILGVRPGLVLFLRQDLFCSWLHHSRPNCAVTRLHFDGWPMRIHWHTSATGTHWRRRHRSKPNIRYAYGTTTVPTGSNFHFHPSPIGSKSCASRFSASAQASADTSQPMAFLRSSLAAYIDCDLQCIVHRRFSLIRKRGRLGVPPSTGYRFLAAAHGAQRVVLCGSSSFLPHDWQSDSSQTLGLPVPMRSRISCARIASSLSQSAPRIARASTGLPLATTRSIFARSSGVMRFALG